LAAPFGARFFSFAWSIIMAFNINGFRLGEAFGVAGASGQYRYTWATYITTDTAAVVEAAHYFDSIYQNLPVGTVIEATMAMGGTPVIKDYVVTASSASAVTIALKSTAAG
jgi:hypothetical protein